MWSGVIVENNQALSVDHCQLQALQFLVHLIDLLSILLRCSGFTKIQKAVVDRMGSRPPNNDHDIFRCKFVFPCGSVGKESAWDAGDLGLIPSLGRSPGEGKGYPLQYSGLENSMDHIVHGVAKSRTRLSDFFTFKQALDAGKQMEKITFPQTTSLAQVGPRTLGLAHHPCRSLHWLQKESWAGL